MDKDKKGKGPGGRPPKYAPVYHPKLAQALAKTGLTDEEMAEKLEITVRTLYRWKNDYPEFCQALKEGKDSVDDRVENALLRRALGYEHEEEKIFVHDGKAVIVPTIKHYPPDTSANFIWLQNRRPQLWKNKRNLEVGGDPDNPAPAKFVVEFIKSNKNEN